MYTFITLLNENKNINENFFHSNSIKILLNFIYYEHFFTYKLVLWIYFPLLYFFYNDTFGFSLVSRVHFFFLLMLERCLKKNQYLNTQKILCLYFIAPVRGKIKYIKWFIQAYVMYIVRSGSVSDQIM